MANLIITVIAIALVAIASLMGAYYGGSAFLNNQSAANASTVLNQAQQIAGAWNAYLADNLNNPPQSLDGNANSLVSAGYLAQIPTPPAESGVGTNRTFVLAAPATINGVTASHWFVDINMGSNGGNAGAVDDSNFAACSRIIKTATGAKPTQMQGQTQIGQIFNSAGGNGTFGCAPTTGTGFTAVMEAGAGGGFSAGDYTFEYLLQ